MIDTAIRLNARFFFVEILDIQFFVLSLSREWLSYVNVDEEDTL